MLELSTRYTQAKRRIIEREFSRMNNMQKQAVFHTEGPLLILAGAGSGKTTVLVNRVANIMKFGCAYESDHVPGGLTEEDVEFLENYDGSDEARMLALVSYKTPQPWQIMAITFTNKAAGELKSRLCAMLGGAGDEIWASTFHSSCARMLRRDAERLGYTSRFTIYDTDDVKRLIKEIMSQLRIDEKTMKPAQIISEISKAKEAMRTPEMFAEIAGSDFRLKKISEVYTIYQRRLIDADAMDFDDLLFNTVRLLQENEDVCQYYQRRFHYIMVDEYQDTNHAQYLFINLLSQGHNNLCVVGDDDQSIYKFRGATIENILSFEKHYPDATVIRLEQNYRSTQTILDAANAVIGNNTARKSKSLWTDKGQGEQIHLYTAYSESDEARYIVDAIEDHVKNGGKYGDHAILYRMNAQSNSIEYRLARAGVPYRMIGGHRFYERKEIKDMLAYLSVIYNPNDEVRLRRIINEPKRGIGDKSVDNATEIADQLGISLFEVLATADQYDVLSRSSSKLMAFAQMIEELSDAAADPDIPLDELLALLLEKTQYVQALRGDDKATERAENIEELKSSLKQYQQQHGEETELGGFLEEVALVTDIDNYDNEADTVVLMTLHSAKGLEFPIVFLVGMEENIFPGTQSILFPEEIEEERRLAYVGITRAKEVLHIVHSEQRVLFGTTMRNKLSRFAGEIPDELIEHTKAAPIPSRPAAPRQRPTYDTARTISGSTEIKTAQRFTPGDRVVHKIFGEGTITSATDMGSDTLLDVQFDKAGSKRLMANFAALKKI